MSLRINIYSPVILPLVSSALTLSLMAIDLPLLFLWTLLSWSNQYEYFLQWCLRGEVSKHLKYSTSKHLKYSTSKHLKYITRMMHMHWYTYSTFQLLCICSETLTVHHKNYGYALKHLQYMPRIIYMHWNVIILMRYSSRAAMEVVILTTPSATSDENFIKMMAFPFHCSSHFISFFVWVWYGWHLRFKSLALWQSYDCYSEEALNTMGK